MNWFTSQTGKTFARALAGCCTVGSFLGYMLPNSYLIYKYVEITSLYRYGEAVPVTDELLSIMNEVVKDMGLEEKKDKISLYTAYGFDPFHVGLLAIESRSAIGLPHSFQCNDAAGFDKTGIKLAGKDVPWSIPEGQKLQDSLILFKKAKKFCLAREITFTNGYSPLLKGFIASLSMLNTYAISSNLNAKLDLFKRARSLRYAFYTLVFSFNLCIFIFIKDALNYLDENNADAKVAKLGQEYAEGGVEFYGKVLQRNLAIRKLVANGDSLYTTYGNDQIWLRQKHVPFTERRDNLMEALEEYKQNLPSR